MVEAALPASAVVALALVDVYSIETALWVATAVNVLLLFVWGAIVRRVSGGSAWISTRAGLAAGQPRPDARGAQVGDPLTAGWAAPATPRA